MDYEFYSNTAEMMVQLAFIRPKVGSKKREVNYSISLKFRKIYLLFLSK